MLKCFDSTRVSEGTRHGPLTCTNLNFLQSTETKSGSWGLGLFLLEPAEPGELITGTYNHNASLLPHYRLKPLFQEYLGELIYELTTESREQVFMISLTGEF